MPGTAANEVVKSVGTGRDYATIALWEDATTGDCTSGWGAGDYAAACSPVGDCYDDADFTESPVIAGATTDNTHYRRLTVHAGERHAGKNGTGVKVIGSITWTDAFGICEWLIGEHNAGTHCFIVTALAADPADVLIQNIVLQCSTSTLKGFSLEPGASDTVVLTIRNCAVGTRDQYGDAFSGGNNHDVVCQNCSAYVLEDEKAFMYVDCTNCIGIVPGPGDAYYVCTGDYNIGSDKTAPGEHSIDDESSDIFVSVADGSEDLHLASGATAADDAGDDLSGTFTIDIDGDTRVDWDIGADEYVAPAGGGHPAIRRFGGVPYAALNRGVW